MTLEYQTEDIPFWPGFPFDRTHFWGESFCIPDTEDTKILLSYHILWRVAN